MSIRIRWEDISGMRRLDNAMGRLSSGQKTVALQRAVNHVGGKARTQVIRALTKQTGLKRRTIVKAIRVNKAYLGSTNGVSDGGSLDYVMSAQGGDIALKFFSPRETRRGVLASPFGKRKLFAKTFIKGGRFPKRVTAKGLHGHVYERLGSGRGPLQLEDSGVIIPAEMIKGATAAAFFKTVEADLPRRAMHEINRLVGGIFD
ncbi:hypothetical protein [Shinella sp.]|uniref:hypothetical protein n=1 Tax=Shinella sp. TaxID=1870904 RepID=UPI003F728F45